MTEIPRFGLIDVTRKLEIYNHLKSEDFLAHLIWCLDATDIDIERSEILKYFMLGAFIEYQSVFLQTFQKTEGFDFQEVFNREFYWQAFRVFERQKLIFRLEHLDFFIDKSLHPLGKDRNVPLTETYISFPSDKA